jgi:hypothetical protein
MHSVLEAWIARGIPRSDYSIQKLYREAAKGAC